MWIPSHVVIRGNEWVDRLAKEALSLERVNFRVSYSFRDLFSFVDRIFVEKWQQRWNSGDKGCFFHKIQPEVSLKPKFNDKNKGKQTALTRLRLGKCMLNDTLKLFGKHETGFCDFCYMTEEVDHFLLQCIDFRNTGKYW